MGTVLLTSEGLVDLCIKLHVVYFISGVCGVWVVQLLELHAKVGIAESEGNIGCGWN